jgi:adenosylcobinamide-phosphate synthase
VKRTHLLPAAYLLDHLAGDPEWFPHPVRIIGRAIVLGERVLRAPDDNPSREFVTGLTLTVGIVTYTYFATCAIIRLAYRRSAGLGSATEVLLAWTCLAARNLSQETQAVSDALNRDDLVLARQRIARIVGRDTRNLDRNEISRALIETLAESASDGVVAPIVYLATGGVPLAMAYKAINTLDSMIGHRTPQYLYFGKVAARLDDAANYIPARITALSTVAAAALHHFSEPHTAWSTWHRDGKKHKSPNAGQPEAAVSGALQVRLGGANSYDNEVIPTPIMGAEFPAPTPAKAAQAIRLTAVISILGLAVGVLLAAFQQRRAARGCD